MATTLESLPEETTTSVLSANSLKTRLTETMMAQRTPGQIVRITQVSSHHFRVNFLSLTASVGKDSTLRTYHISRSQFLRVDEQNGELVITDQTR